MASERPRAPSRLRLVILELVLAGLLIAAIDRLVKTYAESRFVPFARLRTAVEAGDGCLVLTGGSDMESAMLMPELATGLGSGAERCVANLALGGTGKDVRFMAFREYVESLRRPRALLVGFKGYDLTDETTLTPGYHTGNDAAAYAWGRVGDLATYFPEWSFTAADNGFRFLLLRATGLGAYRQAFWERVQRLEERWGLRAPNPINSFGYVKEFIALDEAARRRALTERHLGKEQWAMTRFNSRLVELAVRSGATSIHFVRLPALAATERAYFGGGESESERNFNEFVQAMARRHHGVYIDLSHASWMDDSLLVDGLHYTRHGAELITESVVEALRSRRL